jgi:hypothetical protein
MTANIGAIVAKVSASEPILDSPKASTPIIIPASLFCDAMNFSARHKADDKTINHIFAILSRVRD